jgi:hypothetical protein
MRPSDFWIKLRHWEFWPAWIFNIPVVFIWLINAIKERDLCFFSNVNPTFKTGGLYGESKWNIFQHLPHDVYPKTLLIKNSEKGETNPEYIIKEHDFKFPLIVKPDVGERGLGVNMINDFEAFEVYFNKANYNFLIQEYVKLPEEMSVLIYKNPSNDRKHITSICIKNKLEIIGDGKHKIKELVQKNPRARFQWDRLSKKLDGNQILGKKEKLLLEPIGNHCRGTAFLDGNHLKNPSFCNFFYDLFDKNQGEVWYGRYDLLYRDVDTLIQGKDFKIVEFNGVASEPAHIYHPGSSLLKAYKTIWKHWKILANISRQMKNRGFNTMSFKEAYQVLKEFRINQRLVKKTN